MSSQHPSARPTVGRQPQSAPHATTTKRYFITSEGDGTIIRAVPTPPRPATGVAETPAPDAPAADTLAADRRYRASMRRFLRTPFHHSDR